MQKINLVRMTGCCDAPIDIHAGAADRAAGGARMTMSVWLLLIRGECAGSARLGKAFTGAHVCFMAYVFRCQSICDHKA